MRRTLALAATALCLVLAASACSSGGGESDSGTTIRVWTHRNGAFNKAYQVLADKYEAAHPDVSIDFETFEYDSYIQTLQTALPAGTEADVIQMFGSWVCSYKDNLGTVPNGVMSTKQADAKYFQGPLGGYLCDDSLFGMPQESNIEYGATLMNTDMAKAAGVGTDGWDNFDEFIADGKKLSVFEDGKMTRAGYHFTTNDGLSYTFLSLILQGGGQYLKEDGTFDFNTPQAADALALEKRMVDEGLVDPTLFTDTVNWVGDCFFTELCAMGLVGPWVVPESADDFPDMLDNTIYVPLPTLENAEFAADSGWGLTVSKDSKVASDAWDFVNFVANNNQNALDWNLATGTLPALKANTQGAARKRIVAEAAYEEPFLDILGNAKYVGSLPDRDRLFYKIIVPHSLGVLNGEESIDDALSAMTTEANAISN